LSFLSWPNHLCSLLFVNNFLSSFAEYRNIGDLPAPRAVRLLLSLPKAPAARRQFVKGLSLNFTNNRVPFALELKPDTARSRGYSRVTPPSACAHLRRPSGNSRALPLHLLV
jgi:hypothetical protein